MANRQQLMPKMGESITEATVLTWLKGVGDTVELDEPIAEIATDKVDSEVPSEFEGVIVELPHNEGDVVQVGEILCVIATEGDEATSNSIDVGSQSNPVEVAAPPKEESVPYVPEKASVPVESVQSNGSGRFYSPLVRKIAQAEGIGQQELDAIVGTGKEGRVTKKDMLAYLSSRSAPAQAPSQVAQPRKEETVVAKPAVQPVQKPAVTQSSAPSPSSFSGEVEIIEMDRMRKLIAKHMVHSKATSAHVTSFVEADVTEIVDWRNKIKGDFQRREGEKITFTPIFLQAVAQALRDFPYVNASLDGEHIILHKSINIGMATALPSGNLIVPVIKDADRLSLLGLTKAVNDLANRARNNNLKPSEIEGGTYTVTNVGSFGNVMGTPIINQPQVGILAVGAIQKKVAVIETPLGDQIGIRHKMFLSHTYDHRLVDGALGGQFVRRVADLLEGFNTMQSL
ncbi:MAG: dihydrolipoamide acetyltransferase family protein [Chitinophagales bacterium]